MELINFNFTEKQSFLNGVLKGIAAPALVFHNFQPPGTRTVEAILPEITENAFCEDLQKISGDFYRAINKYDEEQKPSNAK